MRVLVYGVNSQNKGAQLLLATASRRLTAMGHIPVVSARDVRPDERKAVRAVGMFSVERLGPLRSLGLDWLPKAVSAKLPVAGDGDFDYVLDASGYSLTDAWGLVPVTSRLSRLRRWTARGIGFAMLPQAFGPFTSRSLRDGVTNIVGYADHVWARDPASMKHLKGLGLPDGLLSVAPDIMITHGVDHANSIAAGSTVLVPNWNLARRSGRQGEVAYVSALSEIASTLIGRGQAVLGLTHEGKRDHDLITAVAQHVPRMRVLAPQSGTEAKAILAEADLVIAGRYHALVSALSSCVPVIAHSWSHKYESLMGDFEVADGLADPLLSADTLQRVDSLDLQAERARLAEVKPKIASKVDEVWSEVSSLLDRHGTRLRG